MPAKQNGAGKPVCNRDCFHCPYPDCLCDEVTAEERKAQDEEEYHLLDAAGRYRRKHREALYAQKKEYYRENRQKLQGRGAELRKERKRRGLSQTACGALLGVTRQTVSLWERGCVPIRRDALQKLRETV